MPVTLYITVIQHRPKCSLNRLQDQGWDIPELKAHSLKSKTASVRCFVSPSFILSLAHPAKWGTYVPSPHPSRNKTFSACLHHFLFFICLSVHSLSTLSDLLIPLSVSFHRNSKGVCYFYSLLCTVTLFDLFHTAGIINTVYLSHYCSYTIHIFSFYIAIPLSVQVGGFVMPVIYTNWNTTWTHERWRQRENRRQRSRYQDD